MHEGEAASVGPQSVFQVLPVSEGVDSLVRADLLQEVTWGLPCDRTYLQELGSEPLTQDSLQVLAHLCQEV